MCFWPTVFVTVAKLFVWRGHLCWHFSSTFQLYHLTFNAIVFKSEDVTSGTLFLSEEKTVLRKYHVNFYRRWPEQSVSQQIIWCVCVQWLRSVTVLMIGDGYLCLSDPQLPFLLPGDECPPMMGNPGRLPTRGPLRKPECSHTQTHLYWRKQLAAVTAGLMRIWRAYERVQKSLNPAGVSTHQSIDTAIIICYCDKGHTGSDKPCVLA